MRQRILPQEFVIPEFTGKRGAVSGNIHATSISPAVFELPVILRAIIINKFALAVPIMMPCVLRVRLRDRLSISQKCLPASKGDSGS